MTVRELREEIETRLARNPQNIVELAENISMDSDATESNVIFAVRGLIEAGRLIAIDGLLYLQRGEE